MSICSKIGHLAQEQRVLLRRTESHHLLDAGPVVPGPVEQHDLTLGGQVLDVALEVPLAPLPVGGRRQRGDPRDARAEVFGDALDRAALAGGVATLEDDDDPRTGGLDPLLQLHQFGLQPEQFGFVDVVGNLAARLLGRMPAPSASSLLTGASYVDDRYCAASSSSSSDSASSAGSTSTSLIASRSALMPKYSMPQ